MQSCSGLYSLVYHDYRVRNGLIIDVEMAWYPCSEIFMNELGMILYETQLYILNLPTVG